MAGTINFNDSSTWPAYRDHQDVRVWVKARWEQAWSLAPYFLPQETVWSSAPDVSRAVLQYRYGPEVALPGESSYAAYPKYRNRGYWVLIQYLTDPSGSMWWLGYADSPVVTERYTHLDTANESGVQTIPCWGMDRTLQFVQIGSTVYLDPDDTADPRWRRALTGSVFNDGLQGNRIENEVDLYNVNGTDVKGYVFANPHQTDRAWWSTRQIFEHLARFHLPTSNYQSSDIPWDVLDTSFLPNWDRPRIATDQESAFDVLSRLLPPDRLLGWKVELDVDFTEPPVGSPITPPVIDNVYIRPFTRNATDVTLPSIGSMPANPNQWNITADQDPLTDGQLDLDDSDSVDQVIVRGPREIGISTWTIDDELQRGWKVSEEQEYAEAFSLDPLFAGLNAWEKKEWNQYFRNRTKYDDVYRHFPVDDEWDGTNEGRPVFYDSAGTYVPYLGNVEIMPELPLYRGVDYAGAADEVNESNGRHILPILAWLEDPDEVGRYLSVQDATTLYGSPPVAMPNSIPFGMRVRADNDRGPAFEVEIGGAPRHAIDPSFQPNLGDVERTNPKIWGEFDYRDMVITAAMMGDRRPAYQIPETTPDYDCVRRKIITLEHPGLEMVHIAAATIVEVDRNGDAVYSDGGLLRDPRPQIEALCRLAAENLVEPRRIVSMRTSRIIGDIQVGNIITNYDGEIANAVVTTMAITTPTINDDAPPPIVLAIQASTNEVDLVNLIGRIPGPDADPANQPQDRERMTYWRQLGRHKLAKRLGRHREPGMHHPMWRDRGPLGRRDWM